MDSFLLLRRLVAAIVFKGQTVSDYWWSRRTIFLTVAPVVRAMIPLDDWSQAGGKKPGHHFHMAATCNSLYT